MWRYEPPLRDMQFVFEEVLDGAAPFGEAPWRWQRVRAGDAALPPV